MLQNEVSGYRQTWSRVLAALLLTHSDIDVIDTLLKPSVRTILTSLPVALPPALRGSASGTARRFRVWVVQPGWEREREGELALLSCFPKKNEGREGEKDGRKRE